MAEAIRSWRVAVVVLAVTVLSVAVPPAHADASLAPDQNVYTGTNYGNKARLSCTLERLTVTTRGSNPHPYSVWSLVYYRDANQQTWYRNRGWGYTAPGKYVGMTYWSHNGFNRDSRWVKVHNRSTGHNLYSYFGGTEFGFRKPGGRGSQVDVQVLEYHRSRTGGWEHRWVDLGRC